MTNDRLSQIENLLINLYQQKAALEYEAINYSGLPKIRAGQQIKDEVEPKIQQYQQERSQILTVASEQLEISEPEAEEIIGEIVTGVTQLEAQPLNPEFAEMLQIVRELRAKSNEPGKPAALKVKGIISTFPPFVGLFIEPEIDTENFWQQNFPTFTKLIKAATKK